VVPFSFSTTLDKLRSDESSGNGSGSPSSTPAETGKVIIGAKSESAAVSPTTTEPLTANLPAPDFFRSGGQSFASAAAMVNDILAATPDTTPEPGKAQVEEADDHPADEPSAPDVPITPDFFTAQPKKRFRLRR
jgi:hypothetical protein